jgi:hypothetical protein
MGSDSSAQLSLDFLIGIGIFTGAIIFVLAFIPGLFVPFVSNSDELTMTADRTSATIVDDMLAMKDPNGVYPGILDTVKISDFQIRMNDPTEYNILRTELGLKMTDTALYSLEVNISYQDGTWIDMKNSVDDYITLKGNVGQSKRFVFVRDSTDPTVYPGRMAIITVRVW